MILIARKLCLCVVTKTTYSCFIIRKSIHLQQSFCTRKNSQSFGIGSKTAFVLNQAATRLDDTLAIVACRLCCSQHTAYFAASLVFIRQCITIVFIDFNSACIPDCSEHKCKEQFNQFTCNSVMPTFAKREQTW